MISGFKGIVLGLAMTTLVGGSALWAVTPTETGSAVAPATAAVAGAPGLSDVEALRDLQRLAQAKPEYSPEVAQRVHDLMFQLWDKPRFRHQATTLVNMNNGHLDYIFNRMYLESMTGKQRDLPNFLRVDGKLLRGGQPTAEGYRRLKKIGVKTVVNCRAENPGDEALVKAAGLEYVGIPILDTTPPTRTQVDEFLTVMRSRRSGQVFVHCAAGRNRTAAMVAVWRVENGMSAADAYAEAEALGLNPKIMSADRVAAFIKSYKPQR